MIEKIALMYAGAVLWNGLPDNLKDIHGIESFKWRLKEYIQNDEYIPFT